MSWSVALTVCSFAAAAVLITIGHFSRKPDVLPRPDPRCQRNGPECV